MDWIYLSPHLDDAAFSCGGLIWEQVQSGLTVAIWTVCAGDVPQGELSPFARELHERWQVSRGSEMSAGMNGSDRIVEIRRLEDIESCLRLDAAHRHFPFLDCIYRYYEMPGGGRSFLYPVRAAIFGDVHLVDESLVEDLAVELNNLTPADSILACPIGLGNHVDHQITRRAAERSGRKLRYYADYPYAKGEASLLDNMNESGWKTETHQISPPGLTAWQESMEAHRSQISSFWASREQMRAEVQVYCEANGGIRLWQPMDGFLD